MLEDDFFKDVTLNDLPEAIRDELGYRSYCEGWIKRQHLVEDVVATFECWEKNSKNPKISFKFETKEEGLLCKSLIKCFLLNSLKNIHILILVYIIPISL